MKIHKAIEELKETWGYETEELSHIQELMEEIACKSYWLGYEDRSMEVEEVMESFAGYGKKEDWS